MNQPTTPPAASAAAQEDEHDTPEIRARLHELAKSMIVEPISLDAMIDAKLLIETRKTRDTSSEMRDAFIVLAKARVYNGACEWTVKACSKKNGGDGETRHHSFFSDVAPFAVIALADRVAALEAAVRAYDTDTATHAELVCTIAGDETIRRLRAEAYEKKIASREALFALVVNHSEDSLDMVSNPPTQPFAARETLAREIRRGEEKAASGGST